MGRSAPWHTSGSRHPGVLDFLLIFVLWSTRPSLTLESRPHPLYTSPVLIVKAAFRAALCSPIPYSRVARYDGQPSNPHLIPLDHPWHRCALIPRRSSLVETPAPSIRACPPFVAPSPLSPSSGCRRGDRDTMSTSNTTYCLRYLFCQQSSPPRAVLTRCRLCFIGSFPTGIFYIFFFHNSTFYIHALSRSYPPTTCAPVSCCASLPPHFFCPHVVVRPALDHDLPLPLSPILKDCVLRSASSCLHYLFDYNFSPLSHAFKIYVRLSFFTTSPLMQSSHNLLLYYESSMAEFFL
jgi:hypothetical protein